MDFVKNLEWFLEDGDYTLTYKDGMWFLSWTEMQQPHTLDFNSLLEVYDYLTWLYTDSTID